MLALQLKQPARRSEKLLSSSIIWLVDSFRRAAARPSLAPFPNNWHFAMIRIHFRSFWSDVNLWRAVRRGGLTAQGASARRAIIVVADKGASSRGARRTGPWCRAEGKMGLTSWSPSCTPDSAGASVQGRFWLSVPSTLTRTDPPLLNLVDPPSAQVRVTAVDRERGSALLH
jgi:hypothetical protein